MEDFLDCVLDSVGGEVCLLVKRRMGPTEWEEWVFLDELEGGVLHLANQWLQQKGPPRVGVFEDDNPDDWPVQTATPCVEIGEFLDYVRDSVDQEVWLLVKGRTGPIHWKEWMCLDELTGGDRHRATQWMLQQDPPRVHVFKEDDGDEFEQALPILSEKADDITDEEDDDYEFEQQFKPAYLRFRDVFKGTKRQLRRMTYHKYLRLHGEAFKSASSAWFSGNSPPQHTLSVAELAAFRASTPPGFYVNHPAYRFFCTEASEVSLLGDPPPTFGTTDSSLGTELRRLDKIDRKLKKDLCLRKKVLFKQRLLFRRAQRRLLASTDPPDHPQCPSSHPDPPDPPPDPPPSPYQCPKLVPTVTAPFPIFLKLSASIVPVYLNMWMFCSTRCFASLVSTWQGELSPTLTYL
jgi:hypothetical protein